MRDAADSSIIAVGLGEVLWDLLPAGKQLGGAPGNFAYHAQALGAKAYVVSAVGRDDLGMEIRRRLAGLSLDTSYLEIDAKHPTGTVSVQVDGAGVPSYVIHENVAWDFIRASPRLDELASRTDVVCFGSLAQRWPVSCICIQQFLRAMRPEALRIFDVNLRQNFYDESVISTSVHLANVIKMNDQEVPLIGRTLDCPVDEDSLVKIFLEHLPIRLVAITRGSKGSSLYTKEETSHHPGYPPGKLVDTIGAGDAFTAAVAMGLLHRRSLDQINDAANRLASYVCTQPGATPLVPSELVAAIA